MYIAALVFASLAAAEPAPGSDFSPLPLDLTAVAPPRSRRKLPNFPVWFFWNDHSSRLHSLPSARGIKIEDGKMRAWTYSWMEVKIRHLHTYQYL